MNVVREILGGAMSGTGSGIFVLMLLSVAVASVIGYLATIRSGKMMAEFISKINMRKLNLGILIVIVVLTVLMTGAWGLLILAIVAIIGMIPICTGAARVHLSGCLLLPVVLMQFNLDVVFLSLF